MLWTSIYEFFIRYVFGGRFSGVVYQAKIGELYAGGQYVDTTTNSIVALQVTDVAGGTRIITLGNYLSLIATIISITIIVVLCCLFVKKIVSLVGGLIR